MVRVAALTAENIFSRIVLGLIFIGVQVFINICFFIPLYQKSEETKHVFKIIFPIWVILSVLWLWSYIVSSWIDAGSVENALLDFGIKKETLPYLPPEFDDFERCLKCNLPKPERTHHCRICNQCYFRFDHHCSLIGNCIALYNMKAFMLFCFYSSLLLLNLGVYLFIAAKMLKLIEQKAAAMLFMIDLLFIIFIFLFACSYVPMVCLNVTTLEQIGGIDTTRFDNGKRHNFEEIFGKNILFWVLPTRPSISGFTWSGRSDIDEMFQDN